MVNVGCEAWRDVLESGALVEVKVGRDLGIMETVNRCWWRRWWSAEISVIEVGVLLWMRWRH